MSKRLTTEEFIKKSKEKHGDKYDYSLVSYVSAHKKVKIICRDHGEFLQSANSHVRGAGCLGCAKVAGSQKRVLEKNEFIKRAERIHNFKYNYSLLNYKTIHDSVYIICPNHGKFKQIANHHIRGSGCSECARDVTSELKRLTTEAFIDKANDIHKCMYDYSKSVYKKYNIKVEIICKKHGSFYQVPNSHLSGCGCPTCGVDFRAEKSRGNLSDFIKNAKEVHNDRYDYSKVVYNGIDCKVKITCRKHGLFEQSPYNHINLKHNCHKCAWIVSKQEIDWINSLNNFNIIKGITLKINERWVFPDGYDSTTNTIYEFYGDYWHGNPEKYNPNDINRNNGKTFGELYNKTIEREKFLRKNGYKIISIWEKDFKNGKG